MIATPDQARRLLCPYQRGPEMKALACRAQDCMAWRWADMQTDLGFCGAAGVPEVHRLQAGDRPLRDGPARGGRTVLSRTERTLDQGEAPTTPKPNALDLAVAQARAEDAARDLAAGRF